MSLLFYRFTHLVMQLVGLSPFTASFAFSQPAALASMLVLAVVVYNMRNLPAELASIAHESDLIRQVVTAKDAAFISVCVAALVSVSFSLAGMRDSLRAVFANKLQVDVLLEDQEGRIAAKLRRNAQVQVCIYLLGFVAVSSVEVWQNEWGEVSFFLPYHLSHLVSHLELGRFIVTLRGVSTRITTINDRLKDADFTGVRTLRAAHMQMFLVAQRINAIFGVRLLAIFAYLFISSTAGVFLAITYGKLIFSRNATNFAKEITIHILQHVCAVVFYTVMMAAACFAGQRAMDEADATCELVTRLVFDPRADAMLTRELRGFRAQLQETQLKVSACGMLDVDGQLLLGAAAVVTTYAIIMLTFS